MTIRLLAWRFALHNHADEADFIRRPVRLIEVARTSYRSFDPAGKVMALEMTRIVWLEDIVEKLRWKHNIEESEVIEVLENYPRFVRKETGFVPGEDVYAAFGRTNLDRPLSVFFVYTRDKRAIIVSARDMTEREARRYAR